MEKARVEPCFAIVDILYQEQVEAGLDQLNLWRRTHLQLDSNAQSSEVYMMMAHYPWTHRLRGEFIRRVDGFCINVVHRPYM